MLPDSTKQENPFEGKPTLSDTTRRIKQIVNVSRAEIVTRATKYLRDLTKHLGQTLDGHILIVLQVTPANSFQPLAKFTKTAISDVSGVLDFLSGLMQTLMKAKCLKFLVITPSAFFLRVPSIVHLSTCCFFVCFFILIFKEVTSFKFKYSITIFCEILANYIKSYHIIS